VLKTERVAGGIARISLAHSPLLNPAEWFFCDINIRFLFFPQNRSLFFDQTGRFSDKRIG